MTDVHPPKTLQMLINESWLVESIKNLGSGYLTHLAYETNQIDTKVRDDIQNPDFKGVIGEIIKLDQTSGRRVAVFEVIKVNDYSTFIRFDIRILEIAPFIKEIQTVVNPNYRCYYK